MDSPTQSIQSDVPEEPSPHSLAAARVASGFSFRSKTSFDIDEHGRFALAQSDARNAPDFCEPTHPTLLRAARWQHTDPRPGRAPTVLCYPPTQVRGLIERMCTLCVCACSASVRAQPPKQTADRRDRRPLHSSAVHSSRLRSDVCDVPRELRHVVYC